MNLFRSIMKILNAILGCCVITFSVNAQSISSEVIGTAGNDMLSPDVALSYTIGEPAVNYWNVGGKFLTEGFQQNEVIITSISESNEAVNLNVYPNPFATSFNVDFNSGSDYALVVSDGLGRIVKSETDLTGIDRYTMDMKNMAAGIYYLNVLDKLHQPVAVYKLVKSTP